MVVRIISAVTLFPFLAYVIFKGGLLLQLSITMLGLVGMHEFYRAFSKGGVGLHTIGYSFAIVYGIFINKFIENWAFFSVFVSLFLIVILIYTVLNHKKNTALDGMTTFFGFFYVFFLLFHIYLVREFNHGNELIWLAFISAFGCDTGAYFVGITIGKHKLIPELSPKKTIEGSIGGVFFATLISIIYGIFLRNRGNLGEVDVVLICGLSGFFGSFLAQIGDLSASAMKRICDVKDFGKLIPGHGGVLDRFDSVILTVPPLYYLMLVLI